MFTDGVNLSRTTTPTIANNIYGEHQTVNTRRSFFPTQKAADDIPVADDKDLEEKSDDNVTSSTKSHLSSTAFQLTADPKPTSACTCTLSFSMVANFTSFNTKRCHENIFHVTTLSRKPMTL